MSDSQKHWSSANLNGAPFVVVVVDDDVVIVLLLFLLVIVLVNILVLDCTLS